MIAHTRGCTPLTRPFVPRPFSMLGAPMPLSLVRVDHRLVHGQVTVGWVRAIGAGAMMVFNDRVAGSELEANLVGMAVPTGVTFTLGTVAEGEARATAGDWPSAKTLLLVANPVDLLRLVDAGMDVDVVNVGGVRSPGATIKLTKEVHATAEELEAWRELADRGIRLEVRWLPNKRARSLADAFPKG